MKGLFALFLFLLQSSLFATTATWIHPISGNWNVNGNWSPATYPNQSDVEADFTTTFGSVILVGIPVPITIGQIQFNTTSGSYRINGVGSNGLTFNSGSSASSVINIANGSHLINALISLANPLEITQNSLSSFSMIRAISDATGSQSITKDGTGTLFLTVANSYSGGTFINDGILSISADNNLGASLGSLNIGGTGTLQITGNIPLTSPSLRSGVFSGTGTIDTQGNTVALAGSFSGSGGISITNGAGVGGTVYLTGSNSYAGPTHIQNGVTLQGDTNSLQGAIDLDAATTLIFDQTSNGTYAGTLSGAGTVAKNGSGMLQMSGNSPAFSGSFDLNQGELKVNGSLGSLGNLTLGSGTLLSGAGTVCQTTANSGSTIAPGNSIGTITINSSLTLMSNSNVVIEVDPSSSDVIAVNGPATLTGNLLVTPNPGSFYSFRTSYVILTSTGLGGSTFATYTSTDPNLVPTLSYPNDLNVLLSLTNLNPFDPYANFNTEQVGNNLNALFTAGDLNGDLLNFFDSLAGVDMSMINDILDEIHPAPYSAFMQLQTENGAQIVSLFHRYPTLCECENSSRFWVDPFARGLRVHDHGMQIGFKASTGGIAFGWDKQVARELRVGMGGAWNYSHLDWNQHRGSGHVNGFYGAAYTDYQKGRFYVGGTILSGIDFYNSMRKIPTASRTAKAKFISADVMTQLTSSYAFPFSCGRFSPFATVDFLYFHTGKIDETGATGLNLDIESRPASTIRTEAGVSIQGERNKGRSLCVSPMFALSWVNLCPIQNGLFHSHFTGMPISFVARGWDETWNLVSAALGLKIGTPSFALSLAYRAEVSPYGKPAWFDQNGNASLNWKW